MVSSNISIPPPRHLVHVVIEWPLIGRWAKFLLPSQKFGTLGNYGSTARIVCRKGYCSYYQNRITNKSLKS